MIGELLRGVFPAVVIRRCLDGTLDSLGVALPSANKRCAYGAGFRWLGSLSPTSQKRDVGHPGINGGVLRIPPWLSQGRGTLIVIALIVITPIVITLIFITRIVITRIVVALIVVGVGRVLALDKFVIWRRLGLGRWWERWFVGRSRRRCGRSERRVGGRRRRRFDRGRRGDRTLRLELFGRDRVVGGW